MSEISRSSWHYAIAKQSEKFIEFNIKNICGYMRCIRNILARDIAFTIVGFLYIFGNIILLTALIMWIPIPGVGFEGLQLIALITAAVDLIAAVAASVWGSILARDAYYNKYPEKLLKPRKPSIFKLWWRSFHDKVCILITFTGEEK